MAFSPKGEAWHFHLKRGVAFSPKEGRGIFTKGGAWHFHLKEGVAFSPKEGRGIFT